MLSEDAIRWNLRYKDIPSHPFESPCSLLVGHSSLLPTCGLALDIAMGLGGNANFLLKHGLRVIGVDISEIAVRKASCNSPDLIAIVANLEYFHLPPNHFDVIINILYLQRNLWLPMIHSLKKGGILFIESLTEEMLTIHPEINIDFLLKTGELQQVFSSGEIGKNIEIIFYSEGWQSTTTSHPRAIASLIARRNA
jgi:tellurite methyltransferase